MQDTKTIFVTGATGNQGGAAARELLKNNFRVKALTRDPSNPKALLLKEAGAEIVTGDLNDAAAYKHHLKNVQGVFSVQTFENGIDKEIAQGISLADAAKEMDVEHFLYSSVHGADMKTGIPHWESKLKIEDHIKSTGLNYTIIRPTSLLENFLIPEVKKRILKGKLGSPLGKEIPQLYISAGDIGKICASIFSDSAKYTGKTIAVGARIMDLEQASKIFAAILKIDVKYSKLPMIVTRLIMGKDLYKMFKWVNENSALLVNDMESSENEFPETQKLEQWIALNFSQTE